MRISHNNDHENLQDATSMRGHQSSLNTILVPEGLDCVSRAC